MAWGPLTIERVSAQSLNQKARTVDLDIYTCYVSWR